MSTLRVSTNVDNQRNTTAMAAPQEMALASQRRWYALYTSSRHEKSVAAHLETRQIEHFLPLYSASRLWKNGCRVIVHLPLFPNYIFVRIDPRVLAPALGIPGVVAIVGGRRPEALQDREIESLRGGLQLRKAEPHCYLVVGERVRIHSGTLAGMEGVLIRKKTDLRVVLTLNEIKQSIAVEVDAADVEPAASPAACLAAAA